MTCFVFNEWLLHDLFGENEVDAQKSAQDVLKKVVVKHDRIAFMLGTSWTKKTWDLMKKAKDDKTRSASKLLQAILYNPEITRIVHLKNAQPIPQPLADQIPPDDLYLFQTYFAANVDALITTDRKLLKTIDAIQDANVVIRLKQDFVKEYLGD